MPHIIEVTDLTAPELDVYARLTEAQLRNRLEPDKGVFIAESPKVIATALDAGYEPLSLHARLRRPLAISVTTPSCGTIRCVPTSSAEQRATPWTISP